MHFSLWRPSYGCDVLFSTFSHCIWFRLWKKGSIKVHELLFNVMMGFKLVPLTVFDNRNLVLMVVLHYRFVGKPFVFPPSLNHLTLDFFFQRGSYYLTLLSSWAWRLSSSYLREYVPPSKMIHCCKSSYKLWETNFPQEIKTHFLCFVELHHKKVHWILWTTLRMFLGASRAGKRWSGMAWITDFRRVICLTRWELEKSICLTCSLVQLIGLPKIDYGCHCPPRGRHAFGQNWVPLKTYNSINIVLSSKYWKKLLYLPWVIEVLEVSMKSNRTFSKF